MFYIKQILMGFTLTCLLAGSACDRPRESQEQPELVGNLLESLAVSNSSSTDCHDADFKDLLDYASVSITLNNDDGAKYWAKAYPGIYVKYPGETGCSSGPILIDRGQDTILAIRGKDITNADAWGGPHSIRMINMGDLDGNGMDDLAIASFEDTVFNFEGLRFTGSLAIIRFDKSANIIDKKVYWKYLNGPPACKINSGEVFANQIQNAGDLNGDGVNDLLVTGSASWYMFLAPDGGLISCHRNWYVNSFSAASNNLITLPTEGTTTALNVKSTGNIPANSTFSYQIISGNGSLSGPDTASGKVYTSGSTSGATVVRVTVTSPDGETDEMDLTVNVTVVEKSRQIGHNQGGFTGSLANYAQFGVAMANMGDLDGDGVNDLAVGSSMDTEGGHNAGALWILLLNKDRSVKSTFKITNSVANFGVGNGEGDLFGSSVSNMGDLNGDGVNDLAVGAPGNSDTGAGRGAVWILFMNRDGSINHKAKLGSSSASLQGALENYNYFGNSVANVGDLNGNGINELAVGAPYSSDGGKMGSGAVYVLFLNHGGTTISRIQKISATAGNFQGGLDNGHSFGFSLANIGDLNGDGINDLAAGALESMDGPSNGALHILFLNQNGTVKSSQKLGQGLGGFAGSLNNSQFGYSITGLGDLNGDGILDMAVGAPMDSDNCYNCGAVYTLFLNSDGTIKSQQKIGPNAGSLPQIGLSSSDRFGNSLAYMGDFSQLGFHSLVVGANQHSDGFLINNGSTWALWLQNDGTVKH